MYEHIYVVVNLCCHGLLVYGKTRTFLMKENGKAMISVDGCDI